MFTVEQIKQAHSKVKSGSDFPHYIQEIKTLGVTFYETYVSDGHTVYSGANDYRITAPPKYDTLIVANECDDAAFKADLLAHQQGQTDYLTFVGISAKLGIEKWAVCMDEMTCTYYDKSGYEVLVEKIPS
jgi:uncharacterized protein YbcV (DUF1398 family)